MMAHTLLFISVQILLVVQKCKSVLIVVMLCCNPSITNMQAIQWGEVTIWTDCIIGLKTNRTVFSAEQLQHTSLLIRSLTRSTTPKTRNDHDSMTSPRLLLRTCMSLSVHIICIWVTVIISSMYRQYIRFHILSATWVCKLKTSQLTADNYRTQKH